MKKKYFYFIITIQFIFIWQIIMILHGGYLKYKQGEENQKNYKERIKVTQNVLDNIDIFYPGVGSGASEIIEDMLDDNYKMEKSKVLDPFIEEKQKIILELHGLENYNIRFNFLTWPITDEDISYAHIISEFGIRKLPWHENIDFHTGIDIQLFRGIKLTADGDGIIKWIGESKRYGKALIIRHYTDTGYIDSYYGHISECLVKEGQVVKQKQHIANMGATGKECSGKHLHWELRYYVKVGVNSETGKPIYKLMRVNAVDKSTWNQKWIEKKII